MSQFMKSWSLSHMLGAAKAQMSPGVDPGFLEIAFICIKVWGFASLIFLSFLKYPMKIKYFGLTETKLFHFHRIFKTRGAGKGSERTPSGSATGA